MRTALFAAGGDIPVAALGALHGVSDVAVVIRPGPPAGIVGGLRSAARRFLGRTRTDTLSATAAELGIPEHHARGPADQGLAPYLRTLGIELICVATYAWRLRPDVLAASRRGAVNVHASILPRHRGPNPWFWTYHADDRQTGVTVHACDEGVDTGAILRQRAWPLARGYPVAALHREVAEHGARLLAETVVDMEQGRIDPIPQDSSAATSAGRVIPGRAMMDRSWPAERAWHFLAGLAGRFTEPLRSSAGPVCYSKVPAWTCVAPTAPAGTVEVLDPDRSWRLWCVDGYVSLESD
jgi:methionyl-tRNA formyltransferase